MFNSKYLMLELIGIIFFFIFWDEIWMLYNYWNGKNQL